MLEKIGFNHGIFIDQLQPYITEEILLKFLSEKKCTNSLNIKLPRNHINKQSKKFAFIEFKDIESAQIARMTLNQEKIYQKDALPIRVSLISKDFRKDNTKNVKISNLPNDITYQEFDKLLQKYGMIISSKIQTKGDSKTQRSYGYVLYKDSQAADELILDCEKQELQFKGQIIKAEIFSKSEDVAESKVSNIYLNNIRDKQYTAEQLENRDFRENEQKRIRQYLEDNLKQFGTIKSAIVNFSLSYNLPFAFVNFETREQADAALQHIQENQTFLFAKANIALSKAQQQQNFKNYKQFYHFKNLKKTVTEGNLKHAIEKVEGIKVVTVSIKSHPNYPKTNYATVKLEQTDKLEYLKNALTKPEHKVNELVEVFLERPSINNLFPYDQRQKYNRKRILRRNQEFQSQRNFPPMFPPFGMFPPQMMPGMMPPQMMAPGMFPPMPQQQFQQQRFNNRPQMFNQGQQQQHHHHQQQRNYKPRQFNQQNRNQNNNQNRNQQRQYNNNNNNNNNNNRPKQHNQQNRNNNQPKPKVVKAAQQQKPAAPQQLTLEGILKKKEQFLALKPQQQVQMLGTIIHKDVTNKLKNPRLTNQVIAIILDLEEFTLDELFETIGDKQQLFERVEEAEELLLENENEQ